MKFACEVMEAYLTSSLSSSFLFLFIYLFIVIVSTYDVMFIFNDYFLL